MIKQIKTIQQFPSKITQPPIETVLKNCTIGVMAGFAFNNNLIEQDRFDRSTLQENSNLSNLNGSSMQGGDYLGPPLKEDKTIIIDEIKALEKLHYSLYGTYPDSVAERSIEVKEDNDISAEQIPEKGKIITYTDYNSSSLYGAETMNPFKSLVCTIVRTIDYITNDGLKNFLGGLTSNHSD